MLPAWQRSPTRMRRIGRAAFIARGCPKRDWVAEATGLCRPATRRTERGRASNMNWAPKGVRLPDGSGRRVADRNGRVARSTHEPRLDSRSRLRQDNGVSTNEDVRETIRPVLAAVVLRPGA